MVKEKFKNNGAISLILVLAITALTIISSVVIALINTSNTLSNYHLSEAQENRVDMDACLDEALMRIASSTATSGTFYLNTSNLSCEYQISSAISGGLKIVTSTASTTSDLGFWKSSVIVQVNVSSTPISIYSYRNDKNGYSSNLYCGDGTCGGTETCSSCSADCGSCQVCGNSSVEGTEVCDDGNTTVEYCGDTITQSGSSYCNADCTANIVLAEQCDDGNTSNLDACLNTCVNASCGDTYIRTGVEICDDGNTWNEACGDWTIQSGTYCNSACSATITRSENCEYFDSIFYCAPTVTWCGLCSAASVNCPGHESPAAGKCQNCVWNKTATCAAC